MRRPIAAFLLPAAIVLPMKADSSSSTETTATSSPSEDCQEAALIAYDRDHWRSDPRTDYLAGCPGGSYIRRAKGRFFLWRRYRQATPYQGFRGEGSYLRYLAIPRPIVECETQGFRGEGRWRARNSSGAQGPAQLLGWPAPYPAVSATEKVRYWEVTRHVLRVQGLGAWACA